MDWGSVEGKVLTVRGPVEPAELGAVMMHEHLICDWAQKEEVPFDMAKWPMLERYAVPSLKQLNDHGCHAFVDATFPPNRAAPWVYQKVSEMAGIHIIVSTGYYREIELGTYWARVPEDQIWPFVRDSSVEELEELCVREIEEGLHGSEVRAGVLKMGTSSGDLTDAETKAARAVARAHKRTGVLINTHATGTTSFKGQFDRLSAEGVDPQRVCFGHTMQALVSAWPGVRECMKAGATFAPTNLRMDVSEATRRAWAEAIIRTFDEGLGRQLTLGLDWAFQIGILDAKADPSWRTRHGAPSLLVPCTFMPPPPFVYLFTHTIPRFKEMGVTDEMLHTMLVENAQRVVPVRKP